MGTDPSLPAPPTGGSGVEPRVAAAIVGAIVVVVLMVGLFSQRGGSDGPTAGFPAPTTTGAPSTSASTAVAETSADRPEIPPIDCNGLWDDDELVLALGSEERSYSQLGSFTFAQGETCIEELTSGAAYFIKVEPGDPSDFAPDAILNGQTGAPVADVGDDARWFGGTVDGDAPALLTVFEETLVGELFFRVSIGRPDLARDEQLAVITELAQAILPNFPYVVVEPAEPVIIEVEHVSAATEPLTLDDLVIAGEESGEWSLGEGLVQALSYLSGEASRFEPPAALDLTNGSATGVMLMAIDYVESGPDAAVRTEIERFLAEVTFPEPPSDPPADPEDTEGEDALGIDPHIPTLLAFSPAQDPPPAEEEPGCGLEAVWFDIDCTVVDDIGPVRFGYPRGAIEGTVEGWDIVHVDMIRAAIQTTVDEYTKHGTLEKVDVLLSPNGASFGRGTPKSDGERCLIELRKVAQTLTNERLRFYVALELAGCFLYKNLPPEVFQNYTAASWWYQGLTLYFAAEAFPGINVEWTAPIDRLISSELNTSLQQRAISNWVFFRSVAAHGGGPNAPLSMVGALTDAPTIEAQQQKLAGQSSSDANLHVFHQELSDANIPDSGGSPRRYSPSASAEFELTGNMIIVDEPIRFGVTRYRLTVAPDLYACLEYDITGNIVSSWRVGELGSEAGSWSFELPGELTGESVFVVTSVEEGESFTISAEVSDEPDCDEDEDDNAEDFELPDCGICDPSSYYRLLGAFLDALN